MKNPNLYQLRNVLKYSIGFVLLAVLSSCSSTKNLSGEFATRFETSEAFRQGFAGVMVLDPETQEVLYEYNSEKYFTPASNVKLLTFYTGIKILGDSVPALKYSIKNDSLLFTGTGDPSFLHKEFPYSQVFRFLKDREEKLVFVAPKAAEKTLGPGWAWDDYNSYYSAERGAFPMYGNVASFSFSSLDSVPQTNPAYFQGFLEPKSKKFSTSSGAIRDISENRFYYTHKPGNKNKVQDVPFKYSSEVIVELLKDTLNKEVRFIEEIPENFNFQKKLYSIATDSLYKRMLQESDNFIAEQILLLSADEIADTLKTSIAIRQIKSDYLNDLPDEPQWVDGSGLSRYNLITPRSMVRILEKIKQEVPTQRLFNLLAAGGESGTIKNLYKGEEDPYIYAKTGTLSNNHSLSGYLITKSGRILIFSFMNSNYTVPTSMIKSEMESFLKTFHQNF